MSIDDLPPSEHHEPDDIDTFSGSLGGVVGATIVCALLVGAGGLIAYLLLHWMR